MIFISPGRFTKRGPQIRIAELGTFEGKFQLAIGLLQDAVKKMPRSQTYQYHLGLAYRGINDLTKARACFQRA